MRGRGRAPARSDDHEKNTKGSHEARVYLAFSKRLKYVRRVKRFAFVLLVACSPSSPGVPDASDASSIDEAVVEATVDVAPDVDKSATCASAFGSGLTDAFGRLDGTVLAVVPPNDQACAMPNSTHLVIQVLVGGDAYRMVVDVLSSYAPYDVLEDEIDAPLAGDPWSEGWHAGAALDYVTTLGVHSDAFTSMAQADIDAKITSQIDLGSKISVFATSQSSPSSAHLVHRNLTNQDGAIVVHPDGATPHWILIRFAEQTF